MTLGLMLQILNIWNLEQLIISILGALNASKYELSTVDRPSVTTVGTTNLLVADIRLSVRYEQTA